MTRDSRPIATVVLIVLALAACAKVAPPPGGPEDREPLAVLGITPAEGGFAVAPDSALTILFSENPNRRSVMQALEIIPAVDFRQVSWDVSELRILPDSAWAAGRNTVVRIGSWAKDPRGNSMTEAFDSWFTTKDQPDSGRISGKIWNGQEVTQSMQVLVAAYSTTEADSVDPAAFPLSARVATGSGGSFRLTGLDTDREYFVIALTDQDGDGYPTAANEIWTAYPEPILFAEETAVVVPDFLLGTLDSLGTLSGTVKADSAAIAVVVASEAGGAEAAREVLTSGGTFSLSVPTGRGYRLMAFVDVDGDSLRAETERGAGIDEVFSLVLRSEHSGAQFDLRTPLGEEGRPPRAPPDPGEPVDSENTPVDDAGSGESAEDGRGDR